MNSLANRNKAADSFLQVVVRALWTFLLHLLSLTSSNFFE